MSTHTLDVAESIADRIAIINQGRIVSCGTLSQLRAQAAHEHRPSRTSFLDSTRPNEAVETQLVEDAR